MRSASEVRTLSSWCHARAFRWLVAGGPEACVMLLEPAAGRQAWQRMRLFAEPGGWRLEDERGETLAIASSLPPLLDAVDGGVATGRKGVLWSSAGRPLPDFDFEAVV